MQWVGYAELAAAVSDAGGLGLVRIPHKPGQYVRFRGLIML